MSTLQRSTFTTFVLLLLTACSASTSGSPGSGEAAPQKSTNVVTAEELQRHGTHDLEEALKMLRPTWFRLTPTRVTGGAVMVDPLVVYIDGRRMGGLANLHDVPISAVLSVRYYSASEAQGRFGLDNLQGAIDVATTR